MYLKIKINKFLGVFYKNGSCSKGLKTHVSKDAIRIWTNNMTKKTNNAKKKQQKIQTDKKQQHIFIYLFVYL